MDDYENNIPKRIGSIIDKVRSNKLPPRQRTSERAELIGWFTDRLNAARKGTRFKALSYKAVGVKLAHLTVFDLYAFKASCLEAEKAGYPFSAIFWKELKIKKL